MTANGPVWMPQALNPLCLIQFWSWMNSLFPLLALCGKKNWPPGRKVKLRFMGHSNWTINSPLRTWIFLTNAQKEVYFKLCAHIRRDQLIKAQIYKLFSKPLLALSKQTRVHSRDKCRLELKKSPIRAVRLCIGWLSQQVEENRENADMQGFLRNPEEMLNIWIMT